VTPLAAHRSWYLSQRLRWALSGIVADSHMKCELLGAAEMGVVMPCRDRRRWPAEQTNRLLSSKVRPFNFIAKSSSAVTTHWRTRSSTNCGARRPIIRITSATDLLGGWGASRARRRPARGQNDAVNLEIALLARRFSSECCRGGGRVWQTTCCATPVAAVSGPGAILNVADLAAPSVIEAVLSPQRAPIRHRRCRIRYLGV